MKNILILLLIGYLLIVVLMYMFQRQLLYFPSARPSSTSFKVVTIKSAELNINVIVVNPNAKQAVIYFGGNAENVYDSPHIMRQAFEDKAVYYMNYPGYGGSTGSPTEQSILRAADHVYAYVDSQHQSIALVGRSLGTGVAMTVASTKIVSQLVLITPYDSIASVASTHYPFLPVNLLLKDTFDSVSRVKQIQSDVLVLVASNDMVIPNKHSERLVLNLTNHLQKPSINRKINAINFANTDHNNIHLHPDFMQSIREFIK